MAQIATPKSPLQSLGIKGIITAAIGFITVMISAVVPAVTGLESSGVAPTDAAANVYQVLTTMQEVFAAIGSFAASVGLLMATIGRWRATGPIETGAK